MIIKDLKKIIKSLEEHYTKEQIDNIIIGYEIFEDGEFVVTQAICEETTIEQVLFHDNNEPTLTLILSEFGEEKNDDRILGLPIILN